MPPDAVGIHARLQPVLRALRDQQPKSFLHRGETDSRLQIAACIEKVLKHKSQLYNLTTASLIVLILERRATIPRLISTPPVRRLATASVALCEDAQVRGSQPGVRSYLCVRKN